MEFIAKEHSQFTQSYEYIKSHEDINARIAHVHRNAGLALHNQDQARLSRLWGILRDFQVVTALATHARKLFNYHCADLIELYINIAELQFAEVPTPAGQLDQLGLDLLEQILAANMEKYYGDALTDIGQDTWGPSYKRRDPNIKIILSHQFKEHHVISDGHYALEIVSKAHETAAEVTELSKKVLKSVTTLTREARWTDKLYSDGERFNYSDMPLLCCIDMLITEIDMHFKRNAMSNYVQHLKQVTQNQCIHCTLLSHNLWIIIYLLEYSMCLVILLHTFTVLHQRRMMLCHKELQIWETMNQIRRNSQHLRTSLLPL